MYALQRVLSSSALRQSLRQIYLVRFSWIFSWKNFTLERFYAALPQGTRFYAALPQGTRFYALGEGHKGHYLEFQYCTPKSPLRLTATTRAALFAKNSIGIPGNGPCVPLRATCHGQVMSVCQVTGSTVLCLVCVCLESVSLCIKKGGGGGVILPGHDRVTPSTWNIPGR